MPRTMVDVAWTLVLHCCGHAEVSEPNSKHLAQLMYSTMTVLHRNMQTLTGFPSLLTGQITAVTATPGRALMAGSAAVSVAASWAADQRCSCRSCRSTLQQSEAAPPLLLAAHSATAVQPPSRRAPQYPTGRRQQRALAAMALPQPQRGSSRHVRRACHQQEGTAAASCQTPAPALSVATAGPEAEAAAAAQAAEATLPWQPFPCRARPLLSYQPWQRSPPSPAAGCLISWRCAAALAQPAAAAAAALWRIPGSRRRVLQGRTCRSCWRSRRRRWTCLRCINGHHKRPVQSSTHRRRVSTWGK